MPPKPYPSNELSFMSYHPLTQPTGNILSTSASTWNSTQLHFLKVLHLLTSQTPSCFDAHRPQRLAPQLRTQLSAFPGASFCLPRHELLERTAMLLFYSSLASVLEQPSIKDEPTSRDTAKRARLTTHTPNFVSGDGLGLSSPIESQSDSSDAGMNDEDVHSRDKDERTTVAMAGAFIEYVLAYSRFDNGDIATQLVEFTPISERVNVTGPDWEYVAQDDGGLILRAWESGHWESGHWESGRRVCSIECKGKLDGIGRDSGMHNVEVIAQHSAEVLARIMSNMRMEGLDMDHWDEKKVQDMDRLVVLLCFAQNLFVVKTTVFDSSYLKHVFYGGSSPKVGADIVGSNVDDQDEEIVQNYKDQDLEHTDGGSEEYGFLRIHCSTVHNLATVPGRVAAAKVILAVVGYYSQTS